jgi:hypothetical protein
MIEAQFLQISHQNAMADCVPLIRRVLVVDFRYTKR